MLTREQFETTFGPVSDAVYALVFQLWDASVGQQEQIAKLTALIKQLQDRLNKDSHNSSKPPSTDGYKKKPVTLRLKSGRKPGGQMGHPGSGLAISSSPNEVDNIVQYGPRFNATMLYW